MQQIEIKYCGKHCLICDQEFKLEFKATEMMFGFRDEFLYQQCSNCECIQIKTIPTDILKYYPSYYYSFNQEVPVLKPFSFFKKLRSRFKLNKIYRKNPELLRYLKHINTTLDDKILDVGCGKGKLICELFNKGFTNVQGVDKFLPQDIDHGFNVRVTRDELSDLTPASYDLIMMHHVLEHINEQQETLQNCRKLLKANGCLLIRIPIIGTAWDMYKENWVQLDAPRHFVLHTLKSMSLLAKDTGFKIGHTLFDSTNFQFLGSELYKLDTPLFSEQNNYKAYPIENHFSKKELENFDRLTFEVNATGKGDSAAFYLYKD